MKVRIQLSNDEQRVFDMDAFDINQNNLGGIVVTGKIIGHTAKTIPAVQHLIVNRDGWQFYEFVTDEQLKKETEDGLVLADRLLYGLGPEQKANEAAG